MELPYIMVDFIDDLKEKLYRLGIDIITVMAKIGVYLILPFKFIQFFCESWKENTKKIKRNDCKKSMEMPLHRQP